MADTSSSPDKSFGSIASLKPISFLFSMTLFEILAKIGANISFNEVNSLLLSNGTGRA